jgi:ferredoxin
MAGEVYVDSGECTSCGLCADALPGVFEIDGNGISRVRDAGGASGDEIRRVMADCPVECIHMK